MKSTSSTSILGIALMVAIAYNYAQSFGNSLSHESSDECNYCHNYKANVMDVVEEDENFHKVLVVMGL